MTEPSTANPPPVVDLPALARSAGQRIAWAQQSDDLNVNLVSLAPWSQIDQHVNAAVDVLLIGVAGTGTVTVDAARHEVGPGQAILIPKGTARATASASDPFAYLTCHPRRAPLMPTMRRS
jgi:quercetin dioxygenase-like cupin family protein